MRLRSEINAMNDPDSTHRRKKMVMPTPQITDDELAEVRDTGRRREGGLFWQSARVVCLACALQSSEMCVHTGGEVHEAQDAGYPPPL